MYKKTREYTYLTLSCFIFIPTGFSGLLIFICDHLLLMLEASGGFCLNHWFQGNFAFIQFHRGVPIKAPATNTSAVNQMVPKNPSTDASVVIIFLLIFFYKCNLCDGFFHRLSPYELHFYSIHFRDKTLKDFPRLLFSHHYP